MGTSISTWENVSAYFTFADSPATLALFALATTAIVVGLITSIKKHEDSAFKEIK